RCQVHFMRNILTSVPKKDSKPFREAIKTIFRFTDIELARTAKNQLLETYADKTAYKKACQKLDEGFEDAFQYTNVSDRLSLFKRTNINKRINQEVRSRDKVIRIFPIVGSANRLIGAVLIDLHEVCIISSRKYIQF